MQVSGKVYDTCPSDGKVLVDTQFVEEISKHYIQWHPQGYCQIYIKNADGSTKIFRLHNYIYTELDGKTIPDGLELHHINDCKWHNRLCNLEPTTSAHNLAARDTKTESTTSEYKGVCFNEKKAKWKSQIRYEGTVIGLGYFDDEREAGAVYDRAFIAIHRSVNGSNNLLEEPEVRKILANPETLAPKPKRANRKLPKNISTYRDGYRVTIENNGTRIEKYGFPTIQDAVAFRDKTLQRIQDEMMAKLYGTPIVRNSDGIAVIKVKVPHKNEYVDCKVSDKDYYNVVQHKWYLCNGYATNAELGGIHCFIMQHSNKSKHVDHINHDKLDNRRENLRVASHSLNARNKRKREGCSSQYPGVSKANKKWKAQIRIKGHLKSLGTFAEEEDAAAAYQTKYDELVQLELGCGET